MQIQMRLTWHGIAYLCWKCR